MRRLRVVALAACALLVCAGVARADGDPASDTLLYANAYLPYAAPSKSAAAGLAKQIASVYTAGNRLKVALIQARDDLGAIPSLFGKPTRYAAFLGTEISGIYIGPLLIVMPAGYGIWDGGRTVAAEQKVLAGLPPPGRSSDELAAAAARAVAKLEAAGALRSKDILKPFVQPLQAGVRGHVLTVAFYLFDDSGRSAATVTIQRAGHVLVTSSIPTHATSIQQPETHTIIVAQPLVLKGASLCVTAVDPTGNRMRACKKL
ncbi:MAG TPA: hypothetical protein VFM96_03895 [Gaiellaceae bacterium]|nr:hypothetical protein [Gaiellaceae bacterium]